MGATPAPGLLPLFEVVHEAVMGTRAPATVIEFYSYASTKSTIRWRDGYKFRISDHLRDAPDAALRGIMGILLCRMNRVPESRVDIADRRAYEEALDHAKVADRRAASRQASGRKHIDPVGAHRSLLESFMRVVLDHDIRLPQAPTLSWTKTRSTRRFGHHDGDVNAIVISQALDDPDVPEYVLDYVVYHELLHIVHPPRMGSGAKRMVHPPEFKQAEKRFARFDDANAWLTALASGRKPQRIRLPA